jgi:hypothetical protein
MTTDERIQAELDGTLASAEAALLRASLLSDPESRSQQRWLTQVDSALKGIKHAESPSDLRENVMRQIRLSQAQAFKAQTQKPRVLGAWWQSLAAARPIFQVGLGFALGVIVLLPFAGALRLPTVDPGSVSGTLATPGTAPNPADHSTFISGPALSGSVTVQKVGEDQIYHLTLASPEPVLARLDFGAPVLGLASFTADNPASGTLAYSNTGLELHHQGEGRYAIRITAAGGTTPEARLTIVRDGETIFVSDIR